VYESSPTSVSLDVKTEAAGGLPLSRLAAFPDWLLKWPRVSFEGATQMTAIPNHIDLSTFMAEHLERAEPNCCVRWSPRSCRR